MLQNPSSRYSIRRALLLVISVFWTDIGVLAHAQDSRRRLIVETDAGGDPDDEQSLVRLLVYANEFEIEGIIANREKAREKENLNPVRDGLGIVQAMIRAYGKCHPNLVKHAPGFPTTEHLLARAVAGYEDTEDGVNLIIRAVDAADPRPVWFSNWGTDHGSAESSLNRALDRVHRERGAEGYAKFKSRLRLSSADKFGDHTGKIAPSFPFWLNASHPPMDGKRWYHRFSALTAKAGGFDIDRDVRRNHGPLGALYPTNTTHPQKEGGTMMFLYLVPTGMSDPLQPMWGSWGGRYGPHDEFPGKPYYWANVKDEWQGQTNRDNTLLRWSEALQNDFAVRMDWCVADAREKANHAPVAILNGDRTREIVHLSVKSGEKVSLSAEGSSDPDGNAVRKSWYSYTEAGTFRGTIKLDAQTGEETSFIAPKVDQASTVHVIMEACDGGVPSLHAYRRAVVRVLP